MTNKCISLNTRMTARTPREILEVARKVIKAQKERKKRNPAITVKRGLEPEQADSFSVRCVGQNEANPANRHN